MEYIIYFEIAAVINFGISLFLYSQRLNLPVAQNKLYVGFLWVALVGTVADIIVSSVTGYGGQTQRTMYWFMQCINFTTTHALTPICAIYMFFVLSKNTRISSKQRNILRLLYGIPYVIEFILIWLSPLLSKRVTIIFTLDENNVYHRGTIFFYFLYVCAAYYFGLIIFFLLKNRKTVAPRKIIFICAFIGLILGSVLIQFIIPSLLVQFYGISIGAILMGSFIQTQEDFIDGNTNVFNLNSLITLTGRHFSHNLSFYCICIIINDSNLITNTFGINQLNECLQNIALYLRKNFKKADVFYIGQGQFCLISNSENELENERIVNDIQMRFNRPWTFNNIEYKINTTLGLINCPIDAKNPDEIIAIANLISEDISFKKNVIYAKNIDIELKKRSNYIEQALRFGIEDKRFKVFFQPIYSTKEDKIIGAETIVRLSDERGRFLFPEEFMPIAEKTGTILAIGNFTFNSLCKTLSEINTNAYGIKKININLSVAQCMQENLAAQLLLTREKYHIPASLINLEITETAAAQTPDILLKNMQYLSAEGIDLTLDDFGSGSSNLDYLLKLPFKMVKIDKQIIATAFVDNRADNALKSIISMIHGMGMTVMAEGIESLEQVKWLSHIGCDYLQGPYYSKPIQKEDFLSLMAKINQNPKYLK